MKNKKDYVEGCAIIMFKEGVTQEDAEKLIKSFGLLKIKSFFKHINTCVIEVPKGEEKKWVKRFKKEEKVALASLNHCYWL